MDNLEQENNPHKSLQQVVELPEEVDTKQEFPVAPEIITTMSAMEFKTTSLPYERRQSIQDSLNNLDNRILKAHNSRIELGKAHEKRSAELFGALQGEIDAEDTRFNNEDEIYKQSLELAKLALKLIYSTIEAAGGNPEIDTKTGAHTRTALLQELDRVRLNTGDDESKLGNYELFILDMNNFKVGNTEEGSTEFDRKIALMFKTFRTVSRILAVKAANTKNAYGKITEEDQILLEELYPEGSPQHTELSAILSKAEEEGIEVEVYRDKTGGDEAGIKAIYNKGITPKRHILANELINKIFANSVIRKNKLVSNPERLVVMATDFVDFLRLEKDFQEKLKISPEEMTSIDRFLNSFKDYFVKSNFIRSVVEPTVQLRMGASATSATLLQGMELFKNRTNLDGNPIDEDSTLPTIETIESEIEKKVSIEVKEQQVSFLNIKLTTEKINRLKHQYYSNIVFGNLIQLLTDKLETSQKKEDKIELIEIALIDSPPGADPLPYLEARLQLLALKRDGRLGVGEITDEQKHRILVHTMKYWHQRGQVELSKPEGERDQNIITMYSQWAGTA